MAYKINNHVDRLNRFLPFDPSHDQIYEEYQLSQDSLNLETQALFYAISAIKSGARIIILTGDAGHGKTHLCRRLLEEHLGFSEDEARVKINTECDGKSVIAHSEGAEDKKGLRIFKDFSELDVGDAALRINNLEDDQEAISLVCANEGRLRDVLSSSDELKFCNSILLEFNKSFQDGVARRENEVHIINLNYQSVSAVGENRSLVVEALHQWTSGRSWRTCSECDASSYCPILANQRLLGSQNELAVAIRRDRLNTIFCTTERLGTVVTIREMLMILAYSLTSGLDCEEVHALVLKEKDGWQHAFIYYNNLFELSPNLSADKLQRIPVLGELAKLNPGRVASRGIDERIVNEQGVFPNDEVDLLFSVSADKNVKKIDAANGIDEVIGNPVNSRERVDEAELIQKIVRSLRRRAFFDGVQRNADPLSLLGFYEGEKFAEIIDGGLLPKRAAELKRNIISGLHTIQGLQFGSSKAELNLVDPAFGDATSHAALIADCIGAKDIKLIPLAQKWDLSEDEEPYAISESVDWLDRYIVLRISGKNEGHTDLMIDLVSFDCIVRAGGGFVAKEFYAHDVRRISSFLAQLAESRSLSGDGISLFYEGSVRSVSIDDGIIQVSN